MFFPRKGRVGLLRPGLVTMSTEAGSPAGEYRRRNLRFGPLKEPATRGTILLYVVHHVAMTPRPYTMTTSMVERGRTGRLAGELVIEAPTLAYFAGHSQLWGKAGPTTHPRLHRDQVFPRSRPTAAPPRRGGRGEMIRGRRSCKRGPRPGSCRHFKIRGLHHPPAQGKSASRPVEEGGSVGVRPKNQRGALLDTDIPISRRTSTTEQKPKRAGHDGRTKRQGLG